MVLAFDVSVARPAAARAAEYLGEEIAELCCLIRRKSRTGMLEAGIPIRRRLEILARLVAGAELVVGIR